MKINFLINFFKNLFNLLLITNPDLGFLIMQVLIIYVLLQIFQEMNVLRLILNIVLLLFVLAGLLMIFQLELFACFLIVSELLLFSFIYAYFYNLNIVNKLLFEDMYHINVNFILIFFIISVLYVASSS